MAVEPKGSDVRGRRARVAAAGAISLTLGLAACTSGTGAGDGAPTSPTVSGATTSSSTTSGATTGTTPGTSAEPTVATPVADPADALAAAARAFAETTGVTLRITSTGVPRGSSGLYGLLGVGRAVPEPAFQGTATALVAKVPGTMEVTAVGDVTRVRYFSPAYDTVDPAAFSAPNPADFFADSRSLGALAAALPDPVDAGTEVVNGEQVRTITGTMPGAAVERVLAVGAARGSFETTVALSADSTELRQITLTGPFFAGRDSTYVISLRDYGQDPDIELPAARP